MASFAAKEALLTQHEDRGRLLKTCKGFQELGFRPKNFEELCEEDSLEDKLPRFDMEVHGTQTKSWAQAIGNSLLPLDPETLSVSMGADDRIALIGWPIGCGAVSTQM
jgi:hypothetical protein